MKQSGVLVKRKLNILGLISFLSFFLLIPLFFIPWYRLFILRSNTITTLLIHILGMLAIGVVMIILGTLAIVLKRKQKNKFKGSWMGVVGLILGVLLTGTSGYIVVDYLIRGTG